MTDEIVKPRTKVVVYVEGGVVSGCTSNDPDLEVVIIDRDNLADEEDPEAVEESQLEGSEDCIHNVY